jgi:hypothetical protein
MSASLFFYGSYWRVVPPLRVKTGSAIRQQPTTSRHKDIRNLSREADIQRLRNPRRLQNQAGARDYPGRLLGMAEGGSDENVGGGTPPVFISWDFHGDAPTARLQAPAEVPAPSCYRGRSRAAVAFAVPGSSPK